MDMVDGALETVDYTLSECGMVYDTNIAVCCAESLENRQEKCMDTFVLPQYLSKTPALNLFGRG